MSSSSGGARDPILLRARRAFFRSGIVSATAGLVTRTIVRRGAIVAAMVLLERLLLPVAARSLFRNDLSQQISLACAAGAVFSARIFVQHAFRARTEINLLERISARLIGGDVLRANALRDEDARAELGQGMYHASQNLSTVLPQLVANALAALVLAGVVVAHEPARLVGIVVGVAVAAGVLLFAGRRSMERALASAWTAQQEAFASFMDALEGRLEIVAAGRRVPFMIEMRARGAAWGKAAARVAAGALVSGKLPLLVIAAAAVALAVGGGQKALGVTTADIALLASMTPAFSGLAQDLFTLARTERWMGVVARVLAEPALGTGGTEAPPPAAATIAFEGVSFSYPGAPNRALRDLSFTWRDERVLAFTGDNGSGKSTCLRLLLALGTPQSGTIHVDGRRLDELDADAWRRTVAFLPQRPYLPPHADVRSAVRFLVPDAADDQILGALERVDLLAPLRRAGSDPLAVRIGQLSVGQRQRVGVARLLCQPASLVLLDEPDANLDRSGIATVVRLVQELGEERRVALVAHHADLLEAADRILVFDEGRLVQDETRPASLPASRAAARARPRS
jgi:ABC-type transport system involved in cytochrome bd biosynthesis fused ATPase/permease subunit